MPEVQPDVNLSSIASQPGIRRDGTSLDGEHYTDGQWVRFYRGRPKKMGGFRRITAQMTGPSRLLSIYKKQDLYDVYNLHTSGLEVLSVDATGSGSSPTSRTPVGFAVNDNNLWSIDYMFDPTGTPAAKVFAHAGQTALNIDDRTNLPVYGGNVLDYAALTSISQSVSGGCVVLQPYLFIYGNDGLIKNSDRANPTSFTTGGSSEANAVNVAGTKIVKGLPIRGGSNAPSGLFWALDALIRVSWVGGTKIFNYDTVSKTSILAQNGVVEFDGIYYWIGNDRFLSYGGSIKEVPNQLNLDWFFDNLNWDHRNKIFVRRDQRFGEIWWMFPFGESTEPNHAIIYNVREQTWYDTPLLRTSASQSDVFRYPVMMGATPLTSGNPATYPIYIHEFGHDQIEGDNVIAIDSYFETANFGPAAAGEQKLNRWLEIERVEPDFVQTGPMTLTLKGQQYAKSPVESSMVFPFTTTTERVDIRRQYRHVRLQFRSNVEGGTYFMGRSLMSSNLGEDRE